MRFLCAVFFVACGSVSGPPSSSSTAEPPEISSEADAAPSEPSPEAGLVIFGCKYEPEKLAHWTPGDNALCSGMPGRVAFTNAAAVCCVEIP